MSDAAQAHRRATISVLFFEGCPNHRPTVELARAAVLELGLDAEVQELEVTSPNDVQRLRFLGSPTVQVDGLDIEPAARYRTDYAMSCRVYDTPDGLPPREMLLAALGGDHHAALDGAARSDGVGPGCCATRVAQPRRRGPRAEPLAIGGSLVAAVLSSACCWLPLLLLAAGASAAGVSAILGPWRPVFITAAVTMLGLSFYLTFLRRPTAATACCADGPVAPSSSRRRLGRVTWWGSAVMVAAFVFFPSYVGRLVGSPPLVPAPAASGAVQELVFEIGGMHCEGCATLLQANLSKMDGVQRVRVDFSSGLASVMTPDPALVDRVRDVAQNQGFSAALRSRKP